MVSLKLKKYILGVLLFKGSYSKNLLIHKILKIRTNAFIVTLALNLTSALEYLNTYIDDAVYLTCNDRHDIENMAVITLIACRVRIKIKYFKYERILYTY